MFYLNQQNIFGMGITTYDQDFSLDTTIMYYLNLQNIFEMGIRTYIP